jgi:hypothetical protein
LNAGSRISMTTISGRKNKRQRRGREQSSV